MRHRRKSESSWRGFSFEGIAAAGLSDSRWNGLRPYPPAAPASAAKTTKRQTFALAPTFLRTASVLLVRLLTATMIGASPSSSISGLRSSRPRKRSDLSPIVRASREQAQGAKRASKKGSRPFSAPTEILEAFWRRNDKGAALALNYDGRALIGSVSCPVSFIVFLGSSPGERVAVCEISTSHVPRVGPPRRDRNTRRLGIHRVWP
ncbi:hypothetical protein KM043_006214 [Ampulex compressa]|nr:hypothetical protein KM043_006214 [Ampulex compressa]